MFTEPVVDFTGRFDHVDRAALVPKPARPVPVWLGGSDEAAFDRAARLADGFICFGGTSDHITATWKGLSERVQSHGGTSEAFGADWGVLRRAGADALAADIDAWRAFGGTHATVVSMGLGLETPPTPPSTT